MTDQPTRPELLRHALDIAREYGGNLTLRQLYYQLVARALAPSSDKDYKRLGDTLAKARLEGNFPFDWLVDRTREARPGAFTTWDLDVDDAEVRAGHYLRSIPGWAVNADRGFGQPQHVSVWVEKEALAGVFETPCTDLGVSWFVCRGYPSISALWQWCKALEEAEDARQGELTDGFDQAVVLYFGDHDPDGLEIPAAAERTIRQIAETDNLDLPPVVFKLVALTRAQIAQYNPPPFPAKPTSARFDAYVRNTGLRDAWELDALEPRTLERLIRDHVTAHFDENVYRDNLAQVARKREELIARMRAEGWANANLPR